jgi:hypothetical protein
VVKQTKILQKKKERKNSHLLKDEEKKE